MDSMVDKTNLMQTIVKDTLSARGFEIRGTAS